MSEDKMTDEPAKKCSVVDELEAEFLRNLLSAASGKRIGQSLPIAYLDHVTADGFFVYYERGGKRFRLCVEITNPEVLK